MTYIPRVICECGHEMRPERNGEFLHVHSEGKPYYKIAADRWCCPVCEHQVWTGFGMEPLARNYDADYGSFETDADVHLRN